MATKQPIAARRKAQRDFHESVRLVMSLHELETVTDGDHQTVYRLHSDRINLWLHFIVFKSAIKEGDETFSLYIHPELGAHTGEEVKAAMKVISAAFLDKPNPFSGKWNLDCWNDIDALCDELERRIEWLQEKVTTHN